MNEVFSVSDAAAARVAVLLAEEQTALPGAKLRIAVQGGGCSGFQYDFNFDATTTPEDLIIEKDGATVVIDNVSLEFIKGSMLEYSETLGEASFKIVNPNATAKCGCGNSFAV